MTLICERPPIERNGTNTRIVSCLLHAGLAKVKGRYRFYRNVILDWKTIKDMGDEIISHCGGFGVKSYERLSEWLAVVEERYPELITEEFAPKQTVVLPECPTCRKFHEHNHGG